MAPRLLAPDLADAHTVLMRRQMRRRSLFWNVLWRGWQQCLPSAPQVSIIVLFSSAPLF